MAKKQTTEVSQIGASLFAMEPELQTLEEMIAILRVLGEADDAVDPACLSLLADCAGEAVSTLSDNWRSGMESLGRP
jgi:hypothetical protein